MIGLMIGAMIIIIHSITEILWSTSTKESVPRENLDDLLTDMFDFVSDLGRRLSDILAAEREEKITWRFEENCKITLSIEERSGFCII